MGRGTAGPGQCGSDLPEFANLRLERILNPFKFRSRHRYMRETVSNFSESERLS